MEHCNIAGAARFDLFDCEKFGREFVCAKPKPRQATAKEQRAYMRWLADKAGLHAFEEMKLSSNGATFGDCDSASTYDPATRAYTVPVYQKGAYSIPLPGRNSHHDKVTLETLDESGAVVASQTLPREPKKLGVIWDKAAVHKAVGPIAKPARARKVAPPIVPNDQAPDPVAPVKVKIRLVAVASDAPPIVGMTERPARDYWNLQAQWTVRGRHSFINEYDAGNYEQFIAAPGDAFESCEGDRSRWYAQRRGRIAAYGEGYASQAEAIAEVERIMAADNSPIVANPPHDTPSPLNDAPSAVHGVAEAVEAAIVSQCGDIAREAIDSGRMEIVTVGFDQPKASESEPVEMSDNSGQLPADPIAELVARIAEIERELAIHRNLIIEANPLPEDAPAVETAIDTPIIAKPKRSPAHVRAIMAYLAMRKQRRIFRDAADQMMKARDNLQGMLKSTESQSRIFYDQKQEYYANWQRDELALQSMTAKRRRAVIRARKWNQLAWQMTRAVDGMAIEYAAELTKRKAVNTYYDEGHRERPDQIARVQDQAFAANDRADTLSGELATAQATIATMQSRIDPLSEELMSMTGRALRAEVALAATAARVDGWPPAVAKVTFGRAA